jgi:methylthioribose-1-phosphate isomerase
MKSLYKSFSGGFETRTIVWKDGVVVTVDQTQLPNKLVFLELRNCHQVASAIKEMKIRGAPLIGVAAAYALALTAYHSKAKTKSELLKEMEESESLLKKTRPTGVNLFWAVNRVMRKARETTGNAEAVVKAVLKEANKIADEDVKTNRKMGEYGSALISDGDVVLTHCNAGSLATVDYGTALAVIRVAWEKGKNVSVIATETRPRLQGARLTAYELQRDGIPVTLITDNMVGYVMQRRLVDKVFVGADRIVGDAVINKIGTFGIAVLAYEHKIPFYVVAPTSTFDPTHSASEVIIEERSPDEVTHFANQKIAPNGVRVLNPAFDITPMRFVTAIICETGILSPKDVERTSRWKP